VNVYCRNGKISFVFTKVEGGDKNLTNLKMLSNLEHHDSTTVSAARMDMEFVGSNPQPQIIPENVTLTYTNYYLAHTPEAGITNVKSFKKLTYKNIYPNIDLVLEISDLKNTVSSNPQSAIGNPQSLEYSFIIHPGGNPEDIKIHWSGTDSMNGIKNRSQGTEPKWDDKLQAYTDKPLPCNQVNGFSPSAGIHYTNSLGYIDESAPVAYTTDKNVFCFPIVRNYTLSFNLADYDKTKDLVIDPTLIWGTYYGGINIDEIDDVSTDDSGNVYITGNTNSTSGIATSGAYQTIYGDSDDAFLVKFNSSGKRIWGTYYGGSRNEGASSVNNDDSGNVFVLGVTSSTSGIATAGAYQTSNAGSFDIFLAKFSCSTGKRLWGTYYGGKNFEQGFGVSSDAMGNVYITGRTYSTSGIATAGSYKSTGGGAAYDAFLSKFSSSGKILWATYYGGSLDDAGFGLCCDDSGNVLITGYTGSTSGIASPGAYKVSLAGSNDAFLAKFSSSGKRVWATYYGGGSDEYGYSVCKDAWGSVFITGYTLSTSGIATTGAYQTSNAGSSDAFLAKFNNLGSRLWSTYYGGSNEEYCRAVRTDASGNALLTGYSIYSTSGIATPGAYQTSNAGSFDAFVARFSSSGKRLYATFYGGKGADRGFGECIDISGNVYITGYTYSTSGIATSGSYKTSLGGTTDAFLAKFNFPPDFNNDAGITSIDSIPSKFCQSNRPIIVTFKNFGSDTLKNVSINWKINGKLQTLYKWSGNIATNNKASVNIGSYSFTPGLDTIIVWATSPNGFTDSMSGNDTAKRITIINPLPSAKVGTNAAICNGNSISVGATAIIGNTYNWTSKPAGFISANSNPYDSPSITTIYYLTETITFSGCSKSDSITVTVNALPAASTGGNSAICNGVSTKIGATVVSGNTYLWTSNPSGFTSTAANPTVSPTISATYYLTENIIATGCSKSDSVIINVNPLPTISVGRNSAICNGSSISIGSATKSGDIYNWTSKPPGFTSTISDPSDSPSVTTTYYLTETIAATGCSNSDSVTITVNPKPIIPIISGAKSITSGATVKYSTSSLKGLNYKWSVSGGSIKGSSTNDSVLINWTSAGSGSVNVVVSNSFGCSDSTQLNTTIYTGIENEETGNLNLKIYPDPFREVANLKYNLVTPTHIKITIYSMEGKEIAKLTDQKQEAGIHQYQFQPDVYNARQGMYFVRIIADDKIIVKQIINYNK
jgi:hypothetical protein